MHPYAHVRFEMDEQGPSSIDALLDLAPSRTNTVPGQFRQLFASKHADSAVYSGLHAANTVCRDWVLQNAPNMTVRLTPPEDYSSVGGPRKAAWIRQLAAVQRALRTRGQLPTGLTLVHSPERVNARAWGRVLDALRADGAGVTCLCLQDLSGLFLTDFMQQAVAAFPNIRELSLENCAPSQFYGTYNHLFRAAVAPLLPQLHRLSVTGNARHIDANTWDVLFKHPAPHLTEFHTSAALDDALLGALLRSAPSLQQLVVGEVKVSLQSSTSRWGLQSLTAQSVTGTHMAGLPELTGGHVNVRHLRLMTRVDAVSVFNMHPPDGRSHIPQPQDTWTAAHAFPGRRSRVTVRHMKLGYANICYANVYVAVSCSCSQALADAALLMSQCNLSCEHITIRPWGEHEPDDFHTFLRTLASLFTRIVCTVVTVDASTWHLSEHQYTMLAGAMGALPDIQWGLEGNSPLSDQHMSALLAMPPNVRRVCVSSIGPLSQQYSDTVWPWDELTVTHAILTDIQRIPHPSTGRCPAKLHLSVAGPLTDELLAAVMQLGPAVRSLRAHSLQLSDGAHTNAPWQGPAVHSHMAGSLQLGTGACAKAPSEHVPEWRWESLTVTSVDAAQLLRLPWPSRAGCQLQFTTVDLGTLDEVSCL